MAEPTSVLTFQDLIIEVSRKLGTAYYGAMGDEAAQVPTNAHDLDESKRIVNEAIRMFVSDGPEPGGWRWLMPVGSFSVWGSIATDADNTVTGGAFASGVTPVTAESASFYPTMEGKTITITGEGDFVIDEYVSDTVVNVVGDASSASAATWSITADGNYTLPRDFSGQYIGKITYTANTNQGVGLNWANEAVIRDWREDVQDETGDPFLAAVRLMAGTFTTPRRRWELLLYPMPDEVMVVEFPYIIHFDSLSSLTDVPPAPYVHDETIRAACRAKAEMEVEDMGPDGPAYSYYKGVCLPNSHRIDKRSAPKHLGSTNKTGGMSRGAAFREWRNNWYQRPDVSVN